MTTAEQFYTRVQNIDTHLYSRWMDEREHEDIQDYIAPLQPIADELGVLIETMSKRPFGCFFRCDGKRYQLSVTSRKCSYHRVG